MEYPVQTGEKRRGPIRAASANDKLSYRADPLGSWHHDLPFRPTTCVEAVCNKNQTDGRDGLGFLLVQRRVALLLVPFFCDGQAAHHAGQVDRRIPGAQSAHSPQTVSSNNPGKTTQHAKPPSIIIRLQFPSVWDTRGKSWSSNGDALGLHPFSIDTTARSEIPGHRRELISVAPRDQGRRNNDVIGACHVSGVRAAPAKNEGKGSEPAGSKPSGLRRNLGQLGFHSQAGEEAWRGMEPSLGSPPCLQVVSRSQAGDRVHTPVLLPPFGEPSAPR